jgi:hypothetical protein
MSDQAYSLRERVTQLEGLVKEVLNRISDGVDGSSCASSSATVADTHTGMDDRKLDWI